MSAIDGFSPAYTMLRTLRARQVSAVELLDLHLERIERLNPALNAIVTPNYDQARQDARTADAARARGEDAPLLGLPMTIKDCIDVQGLPGTAGVVEFADRRPVHDAPVVARVRAAGAVILGKTNVPPWAGDHQADNPVFGRTNNPWDLDRTPGGSTGGGAAALAAGLTALELGSDLGGSIRVPAAFCGVYGHRPSDTAVPRSGHFPGSPLPNAAWVMNVQGPLARTADDLALALDVIAGADVGDDVAWRLVLPPARHTRLADFRVAVLPSIAWQPVDAEIVASLDRLAGELRHAGARVQEAQPDGFGDLHDYHACYVSLLGVMQSRGTSAEQRRQMAADVRARGDAFDPAAARGLEASASEYFGWHGRREEYRAAYRAFFRDWDVLLAPTTIVPAFPHTREPRSDRFLTVNGERVPYGRLLVYPGLATLAGQPATAFPAGLSSGGLPLSVQAIGPFLEDRTPMQFTALVAREVGGFQAPPGYGPPAHGVIAL